MFISSLKHRLNSSEISDGQNDSFNVSPEGRRSFMAQGHVNRVEHDADLTSWTHNGRRGFETGNDERELGRLLIRLRTYMDHVKNKRRVLIDYFYKLVSVERILNQRSCMIKRTTVVRILTTTIA